MAQHITLCAGHAVRRLWRPPRNRARLSRHEKVDRSHARLFARWHYAARHVRRLVRAAGIAETDSQPGSRAQDGWRADWHRILLQTATADVALRQAARQRSGCFGLRRSGRPGARRVSEEIFRSADWLLQQWHADLQHFTAVF